MDTAQPPKVWVSFYMNGLPQYVYTEGEFSNATPYVPESALLAALAERDDYRERFDGLEADYFEMRKRLQAYAIRDPGKSEVPAIAAVAADLTRVRAELAEAVRLLVEAHRPHLERDYCGACAFLAAHKEPT
jgi:hypothetical protein